MKPYTKQILKDLEIEVKVKGAKTVAEELEVSEQAIRELAPDEAQAFDRAQIEE